jgi:hypothetical protein
MGSALQTVRAKLFDLGEPLTEAQKRRGMHSPWGAFPKELEERNLARAKELRTSATSMWALSKDPDLAPKNTDLFSEWFVRPAGGTVPYVAGTTLGGVTAGIAGMFAVGATVEGNSAYRTALDDDVPEEKAQMIGVAVGIVSGGIESIGGRVATGVIQKATSKLKNKILQKGAAFTIGSFSEGLEEVGQMLAELTGESTYREIGWREIVSRTGRAGIGGLTMGGTFTGIRTGGQAMFKTEAPFEVSEDARKAEVLQRQEKELLPDVREDEFVMPEEAPAVEGGVIEQYPDLGKAESKVFQEIPKEELGKYVNIAKERGYTNIEIHESTHRTSNIWGTKEAQPLAKTEKEMFTPAPEAASMFAQPTPAERAAEKFTKILTYLAEDVKPKQIEVIAAERTRRWKASIEAKEGKRGQEAFLAAKKPLKGVMAETMFGLPEGMESMVQADIDAMFDQLATNNPDHDMYMRKGNALLKVLAGKIPQPKEIELLGQEYGADFAAAIPRTQDSSKYEKFLSLMGMPKAIVASFDLSALLRQGWMLLPGHPVQWGKAFSTMMKTAIPLKGEAWAESIEQQQQIGKFVELRKKSKLYQAPLFSKDALGEREEAFMTKLAQKVPGIKWSERTYVTFLNQLRINVFDSMAQQWEGTGKTTRDYEVLAKFINHTTGRGDLGKLSGLTPELNAIFFSPRFMTSRAQVWGDPFSRGISKETRALIVSDLLLWVGTGMMMLTLMDLGGAEVEKDPRSSDFGKGKFGNTRFDIGAGHQQLFRYTAQMITGQRKATTTGRIDDQNQLDTFKKYFAFKTSPMAGFAFDVLRKKSLFGEDISLDTESVKRQMYNRLTPMFIRDVYESIEDQGLGGTTPFVIVGAGLGVGVQTYEPKRRGPKRPSLQRGPERPSRYPK